MSFITPSQNSRRRKILLITSVVFFTLAGFLLLTHSSLAEQTPQALQTSQAGNGWSEFIGAAIGVASKPGLWLWWGLMLVVQLVLSGVLNILSFFLNNLFYYAVMLNPNYMPAVLEGWTYVRDIANALFILILLWIAFTIIFNIERMGGRQLLVRLIVVALLMNFSLAFVSAVFGLANQLAIPFYDALVRDIPEGDIAGLIMDKTKVSLVFSTPTTASVSGFTGYTDKAEKEPCGFGALMENSGIAEKGCLGGSKTASNFATAVLNGFIKGGDIGDNALSKTISLALTLMFLFLTVAIFAGFCYVLLKRIVLMVFLAITAPAAFISHVIPGGKMQGVWNKWLQALLCWAFIVPAMYFLLFISIRMLILMNEVPIYKNMPNINLTGNLIQMIPFFIFYGFLITTLRLGKLIGCGIATDIAEGWAQEKIKKYTFQKGANILKGYWKAVGSAAGSAVGGAAGGIALKAAGGAAKVSGTLGTLSQKRAIGRVVAPVVRPINTFIQSRQKAVEDAYNTQKSRSPQDIARSIQSPTTTTVGKIGGLRRLAEINKTGPDIIPESQLRSIMTQAKNYGVDRDITRARPDLLISEDVSVATDKEAQKTIKTFVSKMKPSDAADLDLTNIKAPVREQVFKEIIMTGNTKFLSEISEALYRIPRETRANVTTSMQTVMKNEQVWDELKRQDAVAHQRYVEYFQSRPGRKTIEGFDLPESIKKRLEELKDSDGKSSSQKISGGTATGGEGRRLDDERTRQAAEERERLEHARRQRRGNIL